MRPAIDVERARPIVEGVFAEQAALGRVPSLAWGLVDRGALLLARDEHTVYRIASMTKSFTCAAILLLRDAGRLALDDPIAGHAPELAHLAGPTGDAPPLTIRHLMTMSGGLATDDPWADRHLDVADADLDRWLAPGAAFAEGPGTAFEYSNLGFGLLGRVVRRITGAPVQHLVTEGLLRPLGMARTTWTAPPGAIAGYRRRGDELVVEPFLGDGAIAPMGGLFTTVADLARWIAFLADAFPPRDGPDPGPLSRASRREMQQAHRAFPPRTHTARDGRVRPVAGGYGYGLNVTWVESLGWVTDHSGGLPGFGSNMRWTRAGLGLVALANLTYARMADATAAVLNALLAGDVLLPAPPPLAPALQRAGEQLVALHNRWDDRAAGALFADNVDLDDERERRAAAAARLAAEHGPFTMARVEAQSGASAVAVAHGPRGELRIEFQLHPLLPPRVQFYRAQMAP
jgi:CubicO group peptidase (beta-lactamase class C family)